MRRGVRARLSGPDAIVRRLVREALELTDALDAEPWVSTLLGVLWSRRDTLSLEERVSEDYRSCGGVR